MRSILFFTMLLFLGTAHAGKVMFAAGVPVCDTKAQVESIITKHEVGGLEAGQAEFTRLNESVNKSGEPSCGLYTGYLIRSGKQTVKVLPYKGGDILTYVSQVRVPKTEGTYWVIYYQKPSGDGI